MVDKPTPMSTQKLNTVIAKLANKIALLEIGKAEAEAHRDMANEVVGQQQAEIAQQKVEIARLNDLLSKAHEGKAAA